MPACPGLWGTETELRVVLTTESLYQLNHSLCPTTSLFERFLLSFDLKLHDYFLFYHMVLLEMFLLEPMTIKIIIYKCTVYF